MNQELEGAIQQFKPFLDSWGDCVCKIDKEIYVYCMEQIAEAMKVSYPDFRDYCKHTAYAIGLNSFYVDLRNNHIPPCINKNEFIKFITLISSQKNTLDEIEKRRKEEIRKIFTEFSEKL